MAYLINILRRINMKKKLLLAALIAGITTSAAFANHPNGFGIGVVGGYGGYWEGGGYHTNWALSLKVPSVPIFWAIDMSASGGHFSLGIRGDKYLIDNVLLKEAFLHWYLGLGGWVNITLAHEAYIGIGARLPIGLSFQPIPLLELFIEIAPSLGIQVNPFYFPIGGWGGAFGIRLWF
jgi:hypothetical protein